MRDFLSEVVIGRDGKVFFPEKGGSGGASGGGRKEQPCGKGEACEGSKVGFRCAAHHDDPAPAKEGTGFKWVEIAPGQFGWFWE
jgi:hypothetical protein